MINCNLPADLCLFSNCQTYESLVSLEMASTIDVPELEKRFTFHVCKSHSFEHCSAVSKLSLCTVDEAVKTISRESLIVHGTIPVQFM